MAAPWSGASFEFSMMLWLFIVSKVYCWITSENGIFCVRAEYQARIFGGISVAQEDRRHTFRPARRLRRCDTAWVRYRWGAVRLEKVWLGGRDSNPDTQIQSLQSYR